MLHQIGCPPAQTHKREDILTVTGTNLKGDWDLLPKWPLSNSDFTRQLAPFYHISGP